MANPNIVNDTSILGKTAGAALTASSADIVNNAASSGTIVKINSVYVANVDGTNAADVTVGYRNAANATYEIANTVEVPGGATIVVVTKEAPIYLEEDNQLYALASAVSDLEIVVSYEIIS